MARGLVGRLSSSNCVHLNLPTVCQQTYRKSSVQIKALSVTKLFIKQGITMKRTMLISLLVMMGLSACAAVVTDVSDSNHVTFLISDGESISSVTQKANAYCAQYGKIAKYRMSETQLVAVFDCNSIPSNLR